MDGYVCHCVSLIALLINCWTQRVVSMEFPDDFNQLDLLNTHKHLIPRGASSLWTGSKDEEGEMDDEEVHSEEWYLQKEESLKDKPAALILWAAENNRVSVHILTCLDSRV